MSTPRVSIIITNFNYAGFLPEAIESALAPGLSGLRGAGPG
jgi:hypothetical protein